MCVLEGFCVLLLTELILFEVMITSFSDGFCRVVGFDIINVDEYIPVVLSFIGALLGVFGSCVSTGS